MKRFYEINYSLKATNIVHQISELRSECLILSNVIVNVHE